MILPAALRYQAEVAEADRQPQGHRRHGSQGPDGSSERAGRGDRGAPDARPTSSTEVDRRAPPRATRWPTPSTSRDVIIPAMNAVRAAGDQLEALVADDLWPLPTYQEMLFIK